MDAPAHTASVGDAVTAYIRCEDIKVLYPDRPMTNAVRHNQVTGTIVDSQTTSSFQTLYVALPSGNDVEVRFPVYTSTPMHVASGPRICLSLCQEGLVILPDKTMVSV